MVVKLTRFGRRNILGVTRKTNGRTGQGKSCNKDQGIPERRKGGARITRKACDWRGLKAVELRRPKALPEKKRRIFPRDQSCAEQDRTEGRRKVEECLVRKKRLGRRRGKIKREMKKGDGNGRAGFVFGTKAVEGSQTGRQLKKGAPGNCPQ